jgi:hypothetical protein
MKYDYRKVNCFTPTELIALVNKHPQVTAIPMEPKDFLDWDSLENKMVAKADGILKNHIFTVKSKDPNRIMLQEYDGAPITRQLLVKPAFQTVDWKDEMKLDVIPPPGLPDIKWNELYYKWGRFVPEDRKQDLVYFCKEPPLEIKKRARKYRTTETGKKVNSTPVSGKEMHLSFIIIVAIIFVIFVASGYHLYYSV